jgi:hypothetical protein
MRRREIAKKQREEERGQWFNQVCPMMKGKLPWREKRLAREENNEDSNDSHEKQEIDEQIMGKPVDSRGAQLGTGALEVNMVFTIPFEFRAPECEVVELMLGAERAIFEQLERVGEHMKPLFVRGHLDSRLLWHMMVDGGASINIMLLMVFKRLGHMEADLKRTNLSLSGFSSEPAEA